MSDADDTRREWHEELSLAALGRYHPSIAEVLRWFRYDHLPPGLQQVSRDFAGLAVLTASRSQNAETTVALRKLLESKDAAVRASVPE